MADTLQLEEMNRMRIALGMAPLPSSSAPSTNLDFKQSTPQTGDDLGSTLETREAAGFGNWKKVQDDAAEKKKREARREALKKERDAAQRFAKLEGRGLADAPEDGEMDTKAWLIGQAKRQKKIAKARQRQIEQELLDRENQAQYTEKDLAGLKVGHELGDFEAGTEQIITLKDRAVDAEDDEDEDVLENADLRAKENLQDRLQLKKKTAVYDPHEDETGERKILAQYDEELDGKKQKKFTLDGTGRTIEELANEADSASARTQGTKFSLDFLMEDKPPVSDYMDISEIKVKKPKKKKDKARRQKTEDDMFDIGEVPAPPPQEAMQLDAGTPDASVVPSNKRRFEESFVIDDEDLQSNLAAQRRAALKKRKTRPEDLARQFREEASATPMDTEDPEEEGGLIIDETSEFVANLQKPEAPTKTSVKQEDTSPVPQTSIEPDAEADSDADIEMDGQVYADEDEARAAMQDQLKREANTPAAGGLTATGLEDEESITQGLGATLSMLTQRGLLKTAGSGDLNAQHRERQRFLAERQNHEASQNAKARAQRERDRASGKFERMSAREREQYAQYENKQRDQQDSRHVAEVFNREYKPNVELNYVDEHGRRMNQREAFKFLSHQFHGKGSGKQKTEKRLKKVDDEKRREASSLLDTSQATGMTGALGVQSKKNRQAGVRLQ